MKILEWIREVNRKRIEKRIERENDPAYQEALSDYRDKVEGEGRYAHCPECNCFFKVMITSSMIVILMMWIFIETISHIPVDDEILAERKAKQAEMFLDSEFHTIIKNRQKGE